MPDNKNNCAVCNIESDNLILIEGRNVCENCKSEVMEPGLCSECNESFPETDLIEILGQFVCQTCKGIKLQKQRENIIPAEILLYTYTCRACNKDFLREEPRMAKKFYCENCPEPENSEPVQNKGNIILGFFLGIGLHALAFSTGMLITGLRINPLGELFLLGFLFIGATQLIYMAPVVIILAISQKKRTIIGLSIVIIITMIINAGCFGLLSTSL
jgi:hypothetical protein